jgi:hypothetical protein
MWMCTNKILSTLSDMAVRDILVNFSIRLWAFFYIHTYVARLRRA